MTTETTAARRSTEVAGNERDLPDPFRRLAPRVAADMPALLHLSGLSHALSARTRDVGTAGMCLETSSAFSFRSVTRVVVKLPTGPLELAAQGRWQRESADGRHMLTGVRFTDLQAETWSLLWNCVQMRMKVIFSFLQEADQLLLNFDERMELTLFTRLRKHEIGSCIYPQNRTDLRSMFLVFSGQVVLDAEIQGRQRPLARLCRGDSFGGLSLVTPLPTQEAATAATDVQLLEIEPFTYRCLEATRPALARRIRELVFHSHLTRLHGLLEG
jgi:hypothetical protein